MQVPRSFPEVPLEKLRWRCDPESLPGDSTADVPPLDELIGQERAQEALHLGLDMVHKGYNIYVCGTAGTGKFTAVQRLLSTRQDLGGPPPDLCYVQAFHQPEQPRLLILPAGQGSALKKAMEKLLTTLRQEIPQVLTRADVQQRKAQHLAQAQRREQRLFSQFETPLPPQFGLLYRDGKDALAPEVALRLEGRLRPLAELDAGVEAGSLSLDEYRQLREQHATLSAAFEGVWARVCHFRREAHEAVRALERALVRPDIQQAVAEVAKHFADPAVQAYLRDVETALYEGCERFYESALTADKDAPSSAPGATSMYEEEPFHEFHVNVVVDNASATGAPVMFEASPLYKNLFGTIEPAPEYGGAWRSDFLGIRAGAFHRANGGCLIFHAAEALADPLVWPALKRVLRYGQADIQAIDHLSLVPSTALRPEPIPCHVKVIMIGDEELYQTLTYEDEDFAQLFKVKADFDVTFPRQPHTVQQYTGFLSRICQEEHLRPCDRLAMAALVEWGVRLAGRQNKLSARLDLIADVLREADYWAGKAGETTVTCTAVERALQGRAHRLNRVEAKLHELIAEGILLITTHGSVIGQINGLALYELEDGYTFGSPMRITATTSMGDAGVVNIEREVDLSDAAHSKGVLILSGYLRHMYAQDKPLILSASLCVEQAYDGIMGDSASAAEVYALLSSLAACPIDQGIAITGSINQRGQLQPIGGINEKIEGFFDVCRMQGFSGTQGVLLPAQNIDDLMLRSDVIETIAAGQFHLYPITCLDEGLPILTGVPAGTHQAGQVYSRDSVNERVDTRLRSFASQWHACQHGGAAHREAALAAPPYERSSCS